MLSLRKYDLKNNVWSSATEIQPVVYRDTLLGTMYPDLDIAIGDVSGFVKSEDKDFEPDLEGAIAALDKGFEGYKIVGASGSRKKGCALFVRGNHQDCFSRFFGNPSNCINYGSNLVTECSKILEMKVTVLVVEDGEYGTGDCHGKCSKDFALGTVGQLQRPFQFRAAVKDKDSWVAKGTIAFSFDCGGYDLILPVSCFKGNKVKAGVYSYETLYFGVVHTAEVRHVKMSYSVTQYLPWSAVEADILPGTIAQAHKLVYLQSNTRELAQYLLGDNSNDCDDTSDDEESSRYISPVAEIVKADVHEQLIEHPWVVRHVKEMLRSRWVRLATAGGVQFQSCMTQPDENIPDGVCCIPHLPEGEVIVFPYPCRWKWDITIWQNKHFPQWRGYEGIIVANEATFLTLGRDSDGDFLQFLPALSLPNVAAAVKQFGTPPELTKPKKQKVEGTLGEIAVRSMDNCVGLITYAIAKCWALNRHDFIPFLAQQLQIEVDSLKNVERADREYIASVLKELGETKVSWLSDKDDKDAFTTRPICAYGDDTVSRLAASVNSIWKPTLLRERTIQEFIDFAPQSFPEAWLKRATARRDRYIQSIAAASGDKKQIAAILEDTRSIRESLNAEQLLSAFCAFWRSCHIQKSGTGSLVFHIFKEEIIKRLAEPQFNRLTIVGSKYGDYSEHTWTGENENITILESHNPVFAGRLEVWIDFSLVGMLAQTSAKYPAGTELLVSLKTHRSSIFAQVI